MLSLNSSTPKPPLGAVLSTLCDFSVTSNFSYYRARYYDPSVGRFVAMDPIAFYSGDTNLYRYVLNSPHNLQDPNGQCPWCAAALIGGLTGGAIDLGIQLIHNGGRLGCVSWKSVGIAAASGAVLSALAPTGFLLGRGGARAVQYGYSESAGILNRSFLRFGWGYNESLGQDMLRLGSGRLHVFDVPFSGVPAGANAVRDGLIAGGLGGGATRLNRPDDSCGCK